MQILGENVRVNFSSMEKQQLLNSQDVITRLTAQLTNDILETTDVGVNATDVREGLNYLLGVAGDDNSLSIMPPNDAINITPEQLATINETISILNTLLSQRYTDAGGWWYLNFDLELPHTVDQTTIPADETPDLLRLYQYRQLNTENPSTPLSDYKLRFTYTNSNNRYMLSAYLNYTQVESEGETIGTWSVVNDEGAIEGFVFNSTTNEWDSVDIENMPNIGEVTPTVALGHYLLIINENSFNPSYSYNWISENNELTDITQELYDYFVEVFNNYQSTDESVNVETYDVTISWPGMYEDQVNLTFSNGATQVNVPLVRDSNLSGEATVQLEIDTTEQEEERPYTISFGDIETSDLYFTVDGGDETPISELSLTSTDFQNKTIVIVDEGTVEQTITIQKPTGLTTPEYITYSNSDGTINFNFVLLPEDSQDNIAEVLTVTQVIPRTEGTYTVSGLNQTYPHLNCVEIQLPFNGDIESDDSTATTTTYSTSFHVYLVQTDSSQGEPIPYTLNLNFADDLELAAYYIASEDEEIFVQRPASGYASITAYKKYIQYTSGGQKYYTPFVAARTIYTGEDYQLYHMETIEGEETKVVDQAIVVGENTNITYYIESLFSLGVSEETVIPYDGEMHTLEVSIIDNRVNPVSTPTLNLLWYEQDTPEQINAGDISYTDPGVYQITIYLTQYNEMGQPVNLLRKTVDFSIILEDVDYIIRVDGTEETIDDDTYYKIEKDYDQEILEPNQEVPIDAKSHIIFTYKDATDPTAEWESQVPYIYEVGDAYVEVQIKGQTELINNQEKIHTINLMYNDELIDTGTTVSYLQHLRINKKQLTIPIVSLVDQVNNYVRLVKIELPENVDYNNPALSYQYALTDTENETPTWADCTLNIVNNEYYIYLTSTDGNSQFLSLPELYNGYFRFKITSSQYYFTEEPTTGEASYEYSTHLTVNLPIIYVSCDMTSSSYNPSRWPHNIQQYSLTYYTKEDTEYTPIEVESSLALTEAERNFIYKINGTVISTAANLLPNIDLNGDAIANRAITYSLNIPAGIIKNGYEYRAKLNAAETAAEELPLTLYPHVFDETSELNFETFNTYFAGDLDPYSATNILVNSDWASLLSVSVLYPTGDTQGDFTTFKNNFIATGFSSGGTSANYTILVSLDNIDDEPRFVPHNYEVNYQINAISFTLVVRQNFDWQSSDTNFAAADFDRTVLFTITNAVPSLTQSQINLILNSFTFELTQFNVNNLGVVRYLKHNDWPGTYPNALDIKFNGSADIGTFYNLYPNAVVLKEGVIINRLTHSSGTPIYTVYVGDDPSAAQEPGVENGSVSEDVIHVAMNEAYHFNNSGVGVSYDPMILIETFGPTEDEKSVSVTLQITNDYVNPCTLTKTVRLLPGDSDAVIYRIADASVVQGEPTPTFSYVYDDNGTGITERTGVTIEYDCGYDPSAVSFDANYPITFTQQTLVNLKNLYDVRVLETSGNLEVLEAEDADREE